MLLDECVFEIKKQQLVQMILTSNNIYIYGTNDFSRKISEIVEAKGFINDYTHERSYCNFPVLNTEEVDINAYVISCSLSMYPLTTIQNLTQMGFKNVVSVLDILNYSGLELQGTFLCDAKKDLELNFEKYKSIYNRFQELESKKVFQDILNFRKNLDLKYMRDYNVDEMGQYFEDFLEFKKDEIFVDVGGFDGQTTKEFIKYCLNYKSIYIFEPSLQNLLLAKENLKKYRDIYFTLKGLSNKKDMLKFDSHAGSASSLSEYGTELIEVDSLDNLVNEKVSFIKIDIEGGESMAIDGMKNHILNDYPKIAVSVYHKADDFWKIPEQIFAIRDDYEIYMRHYTEGTDETVMFFIPSKHA